MKTVTSTEAVRGLGELLSELGRGGADVLITRNGKPIARLSADSALPTATLDEVVRAWMGPPHEGPDPGFADDLELVQRADTIPANPWLSSSTPRR